MGSLSPRIDVFAVPRVFPVLLIGGVLRTPALQVLQPQRGLKMRPNFALYGAAAVALVTLATVAEATPSYESDYGHVDEYKSNNYKHEAKYPSSYESDDYKHEPSYGSHYEEEDYGYEAYTPSHYKPKYSMAPSYKHQPSYDSYSADEGYAREPSYKHQPSYRHKRSVGYGSPYGSQSYTHKPSYGYAKRPSYRHRRSVDGKKTKITIKKGREGQSCILPIQSGNGMTTIAINEGREGQQFCDCFEVCCGCFCDLECDCRDGQSAEPEREGQNLTHMKEQLAKGLMDCPVAEGGEPECGCECSKFWYWQGGEKNGDCNKLSDLGVPFCYLHSPNSCTQAHASSLVPNGKWKHCV